MTRPIPARLGLVFALVLAGCDITPSPRPEATQAPVAPVPNPVLAPTTVPPAPALLQSALAARAIGDDAASGAALSALLQAHPAAVEALEARFYLAESFARRGRWASAAELLRAFLDLAPPEHALRAPALFWLARASEAAGDHSGAIAGYQAYRALATPIEPYAAMRQAAQEQALGRPAEAAATYLHAARGTVIRSERAGSYEKAIALLVAAGRQVDALALYDELLALAETPAYRARLLSEAAVAAQAQGQTERARAWLLELIQRLPATPQAATAAEQLLAAADPAVTPAEAGRIFFAAERWAEAVAQLDLAFPATTDAEAGAELRRLRGLALRGLGDFPNALAALAEAAALSPNGPAGRQAQLDWVQTLGQSGETARAAGGYVEFATAYPDDALAPVALDRAATLQERLGDGEAALATRLELGRRYPSSAEGRAALHNLGLARFRAGRLDEARGAWQLLAEGNTGAPRARGAYWAGRAAQAAGDQVAAAELFAAARAAAPASYEGARAADALDVAPAGSVPIDAPISATEWTELEVWVAGWAGEGAQAVTFDDGVAARATLLAQVGLPSEALGEWLDALDAARGSANGLLRVARGAHESGVTYVALQAAEALAALAPLTAPPQPTALRRLIFPTPYAELVQREALEQGVDPRLLFALFRQESLFNPDATSWVGARGLAQVMPETGQGIAQNLGVSDFQLDDLYRPAVSVRFGAFYLGRRIQDMEGSVHAALAAYNGGLGNAQRWAGGSSVADPDLFTEVIDFPETKGYVRAVYGFWSAYKELYEAP